MKTLIIILLIIGAVVGIQKLISHYDSVKARQEGREPAQTQTQTRVPAAIPGLPPSLEASLETAKGQGRLALKQWLRQYRRYVTDPRLADIELDLVVLTGGQDFQEAKKLFQTVKARTPTNSVVYPRIRQLERNYQ